MHEWGRVRTTEGELVHGDEELRIRRSPRAVIADKWARLMGGDRWERFTAAVSAAFFVVGVLSLAHSLATLPELGPTTAIVTTVGIVAFALVPVWARNLRDTTVPLSAVESVSLSPDVRALTVAYDPAEAGVTGRGLFRSATPDSIPDPEPTATETTVTIRSADDVREARTVLRTRGLLDADGSSRDRVTDDGDERDRLLEDEEQERDDRSVDAGREPDRSSEFDAEDEVAS